MALDVTTARSIIKQAIKDETYGGAEPDDDATCIKEAEQLVEMAEQAWVQYIRGPEVETILQLANAVPQNGGEPESEGSKSETEPPKEESQGETDDDDGEQAPEIDLEGVDPELTKVEPWEGYGEDRVKDITGGIDIAVQEGDDDLQALISHIWAYESSHKRRVRVLKHVKAVWETIGGGPSETTTEKEAGEPAGSDAGAEAKTPAEDASEEGSDDGGQARAEGEPQAAEGADEESHAPAEPESKTGESTGEARTEQPKSSEKETPTDTSGGSGGGAATPFGQDKNPAYRALVEGVERELEGERVHTPKRPGEPVPDLPWRWADISDSDLHDYLMQYSSAAYFTQYVVARHDRIAMHCREAADELHRELLNRADKFDEKGKPRTVTVLEAEIEADVNVKSWRKRQRKHEQMSAAAKRELDGYHKQYEALSRLETMRHNAWERARR